MKQQLDNKLVSSFMLMVDHEIQSQGQAFVNSSGLFWPDTNRFAGLYTYTCSYKQLCNDTSISGANIMSGVYVNNVYTPVGSGKLVSINHYDGSVNFSSPISTRISGNFAVKEFSVYLSDQPDYKVVLEGKYHSNPKYAQAATGIPQEVKSMPAIIIVPKEQEAKPLGFQGLDDNYLRLRAIIVCENAFQRVAVSNILKNFRLKNVPIFNSPPFDYLGNMTGINYNYSSLTFFSGSFPFITSAKVVQLPNQGAFSDAAKQMGMVDFDISAWGSHL